MGFKSYGFFVSGPNFGPKILIFGKFDNVTLIFEDGLGQKFRFLDKKVPNFDGF